MIELRKAKELRGACLREADEILSAARSAKRDLTEGETRRLDSLKSQIFQHDKTISQCELEIRKISSRQLSPSERRDVDRFSFINAIRAVADGRSLSGIEAEMFTEGCAEMKACGLGEAAGANIAVPSWALTHERRDMTATGQTSTAGDQGGTMVPTVHGSFIDLLYSRTVLRQLGAQFLSGLTGNLDLPKLVTGATIANKGETTAADESSPTTSAVKLSPKRATTYVEVSQQLMIQSDPSVEAVVRNDLATALALLIEDRAISGSGDSNQPRGILATDGIGSVEGGDNGAVPGWSDIVDLETEVAALNADVGSLGYLINPKIRGLFKKLQKTPEQKIWAGGPRPLNDHPAAVSSLVPADLDKGDSTGVCSAIIFGNFADLIVAQWGGISILANPYIKDAEGLVRLTVNAYHDSAVRRAQSFAAMQDALAGPLPED